MADPHIQNILTDPVMRQVRLHVRNWLTLQWVGHCRCFTSTWLLKGSATSKLALFGNPSAVHHQQVGCGCSHLCQADSVPMSG